jgi:DNA-binding CsgD family transcriptional regulator
MNVGAVAVPLSLAVADPDGSTSWLAQRADGFIELATAAITSPWAWAYLLVAFLSGWVAARRFAGGVAVVGLSAVAVFLLGPQSPVLPWVGLTFEGLLTSNPAESVEVALNSLAAQLGDLAQATYALGFLFAAPCLLALTAHLRGRTFAAAIGLDEDPSPIQILMEEKARPSRANAGRVRMGATKTRLTAGSRRILRMSAAATLLTMALVWLGAGAVWVALTRGDVTRSTGHLRFGTIADPGRAALLGGWYQDAFWAAPALGLAAAVYLIARVRIRHDRPWREVVARAWTVYLVVGLMAMVALLVTPSGVLLFLTGFTFAAAVLAPIGLWRLDRPPIAHRWGARLRRFRTWLMSTERPGERPPPRVDALMRALRQADADAADGRPAAATNHRTAACRSFLADATKTETRSVKDLLRANLLQITAEQPDDGLDLLTTWHRRGATVSDRAFTLAVLRLYVGRGDVARGCDQWCALLVPMLPDTRSSATAARSMDEALDTFRDALRRLPAGALPARHAAAAGRRLLAWLHSAVAAAGRTATGDREATGVETLCLLPVGDRQLDRGDVYCALGDLAHRDGADDEAVARWRIAVAAGSLHARGRLADVLAARGHAHLTAGDDATAHDLLAEAHDLEPLPAFRIAALAAEVLGGTDTPTVLSHFDEAADNGVDPAQLAFWRAMIHLRDGRYDVAETDLLVVAETPSPDVRSPDLTARQQQVVRLLADGVDRQAIAERLGIKPATVSGHLARIREAFAVESDADIIARVTDAKPDLAELTVEAKVLLAALREDDIGLVRAAREVFDAHGPSWLDHAPLAPWPMVAATARTDPDLFVALVESAEPSRLPAWAQLVGAHLVLRRLADGATGTEAQDSLARVDELLEKA